MTAFLTAILAHSRQMGARWAHEQAVEAARTAILAEVPAVEAALPVAAAALPTQPGEHWEAGLVRRNNVEHARTAPVRALRDAASEVERQCHPGHYTSAETLAAAGLPTDVVARVVAAVAAAPTYATLPAWAAATDVPTGTLEAMEAIASAPGADIRDRFTPAPGWGLRFLSGSPRPVTYTARLTYQGTRVAQWDCPAGRLRVFAWDEEQARDEADKAERKANHDAYQLQLAKVRAALGADPDLRATAWVAAALVDLGEIGLVVVDPARACLALAGWTHNPGQEGGTLIPPWGGVAVGARGAITAWAAHPGVDEPHPGVEAVQAALGGLGEADHKGNPDLIAYHHPSEDCTAASPRNSHPAGWAVAGNQGYEKWALSGLTLAQAGRLIRRLS